MKLKKADMHVHTSFSKEIIPGGIYSNSKYAKFINLTIYLIKIYKKLFRMYKSPIFDKNFHLMYRSDCTPEQMYKLAKERGMDYVVFTDHDTIDGWVHFIKKYPDKAKEIICGEEVTTRFKEDPYEIHVNVYGFDNYSIEKAIKIHNEIQENSNDVKKVIKISKKYNLIAVLNHLGFYDVNVPYHILTEKEIKMYLDNFNIFEVLNGDASEETNKARYMLTKRFNKKIIGGSDSHSTTAGTVYTAAKAKNKKEFLKQIKKGNVHVVGKHGTVKKRIQQFLKVLKKGTVVYYSDSDFKDFKAFIRRSAGKSILIKIFKPFMIRAVKRVIEIDYFAENITAEVIHDFLKHH